MMKLNKMLLGALGVGMASFVGMAQAADNTVLLKIHDIVPVKNADGNVIACDVGATFYNRTSSDIKNAALNLIWIDEVVGEVINQEERNAKEARRANRRNVSRYNTASYNSKDVVLKLRLPPLKSHQQVTLKSKVATDRCFLLLNDVEVDVQNCGVSSGEERKSRVANTSCEGLFTFVSPSNPEYYNDFQTISYQEQIANESAAVLSKKEALDIAFQDAVKQVNELNKSLDGASKGAEVLDETD